MKHPMQYEHGWVWSEFDGTISGSAESFVFNHPDAVRHPTKWGDVWKSNDYEWYPPSHPIEVADDALMMRCNIESSDLTTEEYNAILVAVIDAEPDGQEAQYQAVRRTAYGLAVAGGWDGDIEWPPEAELDIAAVSP